jgi:hypothetical protein
MARTKRQERNGKSETARKERLEQNGKKGTARKERQGSIKELCAHTKKREEKAKQLRKDYVFTMIAKSMIRFEALTRMKHFTRF